MPLEDDEANSPWDCTGPVQAHMPTATRQLLKGWSLTMYSVFTLQQFSLYIQGQEILWSANSKEEFELQVTPLFARNRFLSYFNGYIL